MQAAANVCNVLMYSAIMLHSPITKIIYDYVLVLVMPGMVGMGCHGLYVGSLVLYDLYCVRH